MNDVLCKKSCPNHFFAKKTIRTSEQTRKKKIPTYSRKFRIIHYFEVLVSITDKIHVLGGKHLHKRTLVQDLDQVVK
jgi:hypothetical protein